MMWELDGEAVVWMRREVLEMGGGKSWESLWDSARLRCSP